MTGKVVQLHRKFDLATAQLQDAKLYPGCVIMLGCEICGWAKGYDVWKIASRLFERRDGNLYTYVADVAKHVRARCPHCKGKHWSTQFAYPAHINEREAKRLQARTRN